MKKYSTMRSSKRVYHCWTNVESLKRRNQNLMKLIKKMNLVDLKGLVARFEYEYDIEIQSEALSTESIDTTGIEGILKFIGEGEDLGTEKLMMEYQDIKKKYLELKN